MNSGNYPSDPSLQPQATGAADPGPEEISNGASNSASNSTGGPYPGPGQDASARPAPPPPPPAPDRYASAERTRQRKDSALPYKSPTLATLLSLLPGLGQVYVGYYQQGFQFVLVVACMIAVLNMQLPSGLEPLFGVFLPFFWIFNMIDANRRAHSYNQALDGLTGDELPDDFKLPGARGSVPAGVILIVVGVLAILDLNTGFSLEWLEDWWPLGLVAGGVWLILRARRQAR